MNGLIKQAIIFPFLLFASISIFAQPTVTSLTYNTADQQFIEVNFSEAVTTTTGTTGWTIRINGVVQAIIGPSGNGTNYWMFLLPAPIKCGQTVTVQYSGTGDCHNAALQQLAAFGPSNAVNNNVISCSMLSGVQGISVDSLSSPCAPVTVKLTVFWEWSPQARNSINFNPARMRARINWTPTDLVNYTLTETAVCSGRFKTSQIWTYPVDGIECVYTPESFPYYLGPPVAMCNGGSATLVQSIVSYNTDAVATGILEIVPDTIFVCRGQSFDETFDDATLFNCRREIEPVRPNIEERYVQYIYGTSATANRIPNVYVNGNQITDNDGNAIGYPTASGFYEGPVMIYDSAAPPFPNMVSFPIIHTGDYDNDQVNDIFEITIRNWNPCNPYNFGFGTPVTTRSYIKIIDAPPPPDASDQNYCFSAVGPLTASGHYGGTLTWYGDSTLAVPLATGSPFNHGQTAVGTYYYWVTETQATCEGPARKVTLNIVQRPDQPIINVTSGSTSFCYDGSASVTLTADPQSPPPVTSYQWYRDGSPIAGATGVSITLSTAAQSGSYTVRSYGSAPTYCESAASTAVAISIYALATTTNPTNQTVCENPNTATFSVTTGGAAHSNRWQVSTNGGSSWSILSDGGVYNGTTTETLTITNAPYSYDNYMYRMRVRTTAGSCDTYSNPATLIVNPRPVFDSNPVNTSACENGSTSFSVSVSIPEGSISSYAWQRRIPAQSFQTITAAFDGGIYSNFNTATLLINPVTETVNNYSYRVTVSSSAGCARNSNSVTLTVNLLADITTHPQNTSVCQNGNTSFTVVTDGSPAVIAYQWQVSTNGGSTWNNVLPSAVYQNPTSQTLGLQGTPLGYNGYQYRVILTTNGPCPITSNVATLTVNPVPSANITPDPLGEFCNGDTRNLNGNPAGGTPGYSHAWTGTGAGYLNNTAIQNPAFTAPSIGSLTNYTLIYTVTDTRGCQATDNVSAIVNPLVTVNITRDIAGEVCSGTVIQLDGNAGGGTPGYTHLWTGSGTAYLNATNIETPVFTAPAAAVQSTYSLTYTATDTKGCDNSQTINIVVNPNPSANVTLSDNGPLCYNETSVANGNPAGGTPAYTHQWTGTGSGFLSSTNTQSPTFTAPSIGALTSYALNYRVTDSKNCQATSTINISVFPHVQNAVLSGDTSICPGQSANLKVVITGGVSPYNVQLRDDLNNPINASPYISGNPISTGALFATRSYTIFSVTDANGCPATNLFGNPTVTVGAALISAVLSGGTQICLGSSANLRVTVNGGAPPFSLVINGFGTVNNYISGANINLGALTVGTHTYNLTSVTDACGNIISGAAVNAGNPQNVVVDDIPDASTTSNTAPLICNNSSTNITLNADVVGTTFNWTVTDLNGAGASAGSGVISTVIAQVLSNATNNVISATYHITPTGPVPTSCPGTTVDRTVQIEPIPVAQSSVANLTICSGENISFTVTSPTNPSVPANLYFDYTVTSTNIPATGGTAYSGGSGRPFPTTISGTLTNSSGSDLTVTYNITPRYTGCANGTAIQVTILVRPQPRLMFLDKTICSDIVTGITLQVAAGSTSASSFNILSINNGGLTASAGSPTAPISGVGPNEISDDAWTNTTNAPVNVVYTVNCIGTNGCTGPDSTIVVRINPEPVLANLSTTVCSDIANALNLSVTAGSVAASNYNINSITNNGLTASAGNPTAPVTGAPATVIADDAWTNRTAANVNVLYSVVPVSGAGCAGNANNVTITVRPEPVLANFDRTICSDVVTNITLGVTGGSIGASSYNINVINNGGLTASAGNPVTGNGRPANELINDAWTNTTLNPVIVIYTVQPVGTNACLGDNDNVDVTINPEPTLADLNTPTCSDSPTGVTLVAAAGSVAATLFDITSINFNGLTASGGSPATGNNLTSAVISDDQYTNQTIANVDVTYTIVPKSAATCIGDAKNVVITVRPEPVLANLNKTICSDIPAEITLAVAAGSSPASSYNITNIQSNGLTASAGSPAIANGVDASEIFDDAWTNTTNASVNVIYSVQPVGTNSCPGDIYTITATINPKPVLADLSTTVCSDVVTNLNLSVAGGSFPAATYNITTITDNGLTPSAGSPATGTGFAANVIANDAWNNITSASVSVLYTVVPVAVGGCEGNAKDVIITVNPEPVITPGQNPSVCSNVPLNYEILMNNFTNPGDIVTFTWPLPTLDPNITGGTDRIVPLIANITDTYINISGSLGTATYYITPTYNGCAGDIETVVIDVGAQPVLADLDTAACSDVAIGLVLDVDAGSVPAASYNIVDIDWDPNLNVIFQATSVPQNYVADTYLQNDTYRNLTGVDRTVVYSVVPVFTPGCVGAAKDITITIHPEPIILLGQTKTICNGESANMEILLNPANTPAGSEFRWDKPTMNDGSDQGTAQSGVAADPAGTFHITDAFINAPTALPYTPITATYYVTPTSSFGCDGDSIPVVITINPKPNTSAISGSDEACVNTTNMVYSVTPTGGSRYYWYVPPSLGAITFGGTINDAFFIMNAAGSAAADSISVIERNSFTCWGDTVKFGLEIFDYPPVAVVAGDNSVCAGEAGQIYSVPNNAGSTYNWSVPIGASITSFPVTINQITVTFGSISGNISVVETNQAGCVTNHTPLNVTVNPLPSPTITPSKALICLGEAVTFTAGPAGAANYTFFVDGVLAQDGAANTYITDSLTNGQGVTVEVTLASGCHATSTASYVIVSDPPVVTLTSSDADNRICAGTSVTFTANSVTATSFEFRVNGIAQQSGASKTYVTTTLTNGDIVSVIGTTAFGCSAPGNTITMQVDPLPVANFTGTATICFGATTNLAVNFTTGTGPYQIQVNQGVGTISPYNSGAAIPVAPPVTTTYSLLSIADANGCSVTAPSANITGQPIVTVLEDMAISVQPFPVTDCPGSDVAFSVLATGASPTYQWRRNGTNLVNDGRITGVLTANLNIANISAADAGNYDVIASGACQPDTSNSVVLTVLEDIQITSHPVNVVECPGETVQFGVVATGTNPTYRWRKNGSPLSDGGSISGSDTDTLTITNINSFTAGTYDVVVSGTCAPATSNPATLTINVQPQITAQPTSLIICEELSTTFTVNAGSTTGPIYHWQVDDGGGFDTITGGPYAGFNTNTLTVNPVSSSMNGYVYRVIVSGTCDPPVTSLEVTLTVRENPEIITPPADSTVCESSSVAFGVDAGVTTNPTYTWEVYNGSTWSTITGAPYSGYNTSTLGLASATSAYNNYRYRVTVNGICPVPVTSTEATLTVLEKPEVTVQPTAAAECEDGFVTFSVNAGVTTAPAYQWQVDAGGGFTDVSGGIYSGDNTNMLTVNPITTPMNGYRYRAVISGTCTPDAYSNPALLTIREKPEITLQPTSQIVCENDNTQFTVNPGVTTAPTFLWQYSTDNGAIWNPAPTDAQHSGGTTNTLSITGALPSMNAWQYRVVVSGSCGPSVTSNAVILTVNQRPEITLDPVDSEICEDANTSFTVNAGVTTSPTYQWQVSTGGAFANIFGGVYSGENTPTLNLTGVPSNMNGYRYRVIIGGTCIPNVISDTAYLTVNQKPEVTLQPADRTICEGDNTIFNINTGVTTAPTVQWEYNDGGGWNTLMADANHLNVTDDTLLISGALSSMNANQYRAVVSGTCAPAATSNAAILTVREDPEIITQPLDSTICEGSGASFTIDAGVTTGATYQWQVDPNTGTFVNVSGALYSGQTTSTLNIFNVPSTYNGYRYRVVISGNCPPAVTSDTVTLTVRERPEIISQPANAVVCENDIAQFIVDAGVTNNPVYTWEVNDGGGFDVITGGPYTGFNTNILEVNPTTSTMNNYSYRVTVSGACTPGVTSNIVFLTVDERPEIITDPQDTAVCEGMGTVFSVNTGVTTNPTYLWQVNDGGGWVTATGGVYVNEATANLGLTSTTSAMNGFRYRVVVGGKCTPTDTSAEAVLTIRERPEVTVPPANVTECEDGIVSFTVDPGVTTNPTYQWQVDQGYGFFNISGGIYSGINNDTITITGITSVMNNYKYRAVVSGTCTPSANSASAILTVDEKPEVASQPVDKTICEDESTFFRVHPGVTTAPTFRWEYSSDNGVSWNPVPLDAWHSGLTNDTLFITGAVSTMNGWQYRGIISGTCTPDATSNAAILTIDEKPEIAIQPVDSAICENSNAAFFVDAGVTTSATYQWQVDPNTGTFSNVSGGYYAGGTTPVLNVVNAISNMNGYRYRVIISGACAPSTISDTVILTVYQRPEVTANPVSNTICEGDNTFFRINAGVTTSPAYQWEVDDGSGGGFVAVVTGPQYSGINDDTLRIISGTSAMDNFQYRAVVSGICGPEAYSIPAVLTVRERPEIISQPVDSTICEGGSASFMVDAGVTTGVSYQWQVDKNTGSFVNITGAGYSGQTTSMLNVFNVPSTWNGYRYRVVVSGSCTPAVTSDTVTLTVLQRPEITAQPANSVVCEGLGTLFTVNPGVTTNPVFIWMVDEGSGYDTITGGIYTGYNSATLNVTTTSSIMNGWLYKVSVGGTCTPEVTSSEVILTIDENPEVIVNPSDTTVCEGTGAAFFVDAGVTTNPQFKWQVNTGAVWADVSGSPYIGQATSSLTLTNTTSAMNNNRYRVIVSGKCSPADTSGEAVLGIYEKPEVTVHPVDQIQCEDGTVIYFVNPGVTTNPTYQWQVDKGSGFFDITDLNYSGINNDTLTVSAITSSMHGYRYRAIVSGTCAPADAISNPARLYVNEKPEVTQHPANITVCENDIAFFRVNPGVTTAPTFQWEYSVNNGVTWNTVPAAAPYSGITNDTLFIANATTAMNNYQYRAVVSGTCIPPTATSNPAILTVHVRPVITMQPADRNICENDNTTFTVDAGTTTSPTYQWQVDQGSGFNNAGGGVYSGVNTATLTLTNVPSYMTGYRYQVIIGGSCSPSVTSNIVTLTVNEKPEVMLHPASVTVCEDDNTMFTVNPGVTTSPTYQWQVNQGAGWVGVPFAAPYTGADNDTLLITGVTAGMNTYKYRVIISGTCPSPVTSNDALLTVRQKPEIVADPVDQTICEDGSTTFTVDPGVTTNPTYQWQMDPGTGTFINVSGGFYSGQNSQTLTVTGVLSAMNGYRYQVIVGGYCSPSVTSGIAVLNINEKPEITRMPVNETTCEGDETYFAIDAGVTTNPTYQWEVDDGSGGGFVPIAAGPYTGTNTDSLVITSVTSAMNTYMYRVVVTGTCTPPATSFPAILFVSELPEVTVPPEDTTVCENGNAAFLVDAGSTASPTYRWQVNTGSGFNNITDGGKYIGSMTSRLSIFNATSDMNGYEYRVLIGGSCPPQVPSPSAILTVNTKPYITGQPVDATICEGVNTSFNAGATGSSLTYEWEVDKNDGNGFGTVIDGGIYSGATTATLQLTGATRTYNNYNYRVIVNGTCAPPMTSNIARLMVNTPPEILTEPVNETICEFNNTSFFVIAIGGNITYQWQENNGTGWQNLNNTGNYIGTTSASLNIFNIARTMNGYRYRVQISGICTPAATSAEVLLTVNTSPEILIQPSDTTVCETLPLQFNVSAQGTNLTYQWQENSGGGFTDIIDGGKYSGATSVSLIITDPTPLMTGYSYRVMIGGECPPSALSDYAVLTVNTFPSIFTQPEDKEICENGVTAFISNATGTGISYQWQENSGSGFTSITDGGVYNGATTTTLTISNAPVSLNGNSYRLQVVGACAPINSDEVDLIVNANPTADIKGDGMFPMICGGLDLNLDGSPAGGSGTYTNHTWSGDVFPLTSINTRTTVFNTVIPGMYNLTYTVTDSKNCKASDVKVITNERPQVQFISDAKPSCGLLTVNFTNQSTGAVSYQWDFNDPSSPDIVTDENTSHDFTNYTPQIYYYNVSLVGLSQNGCGDTMRQVITLYPSIDASFTIDPLDGCNPVTASLDAIPGGAEYFWDFDDGNAEPGGASVAHQFMNTTENTVTYTVELTTTSFYGCTDTKTADITVYPLPVVNFSADPALQQYPAANVTFTNLTPTGSWTYLWKFDDGNTSTDVSPVHTYATPGDYNVTLTVLSAECTDSISHKITIIPAAPVADFMPPETGCAPLEITFSNQSVFATSYLWDFGNGSQSSKQNPTFTYYEAGVYAVKLIVTGPGGTDNITRLVTVQQTPTAYSNVAPTYVFVNDVPIKCFNLSTDTVNPSYLWDFGDNHTSDEFEPVHVYMDPGRYDVTLTVTNENLCTDEYVFSYIDVEPAGQVIFPNVFKPNPNGPSGGQYNPGADNNEIFFPGVFDQVAEYELVIYNRWGEMIFISKDVNIGWDGYIKDKLAEQGVYIWKVKVKYANGKVENLAGDITLLR